jgi:hypothetical protein
MDQQTDLRAGIRLVRLRQPHNDIHNYPGERTMASKFASPAAVCIFTLVGAAVSAMGYAQNKHPYSHSSPPETSRYLRDTSIDVDDVPGHKIRIVEIERTYVKDAPVVMGTRVVETWSRVFTDYVGGAGPGHGYETWVLEDGNKIFLESVFLSASEATASGSRRGVSHSTLRFTGGTGIFASLQGTLLSSVEFDTDPNAGFSRPSTRGEYWLAK